MFFKIVLMILLIVCITLSILYYIYNYKRLFIINSPTYMGPHNVDQLNKKSKKNTSDCPQDDEDNEDNVGNVGNVGDPDEYYNRDFESKSVTFKDDSLHNNHNDYNYSYTFFIKIDSLEYKYNENKEVFSKGSSIYKYSTDDNNVYKEQQEIINSSHNPRVYIAKNTNDIVIEVTTYKNTERCVVDNIPLQAWVAMGIVLHNKTIDVYINGKLFKSCELLALPVPSHDTIRYGNNGGFDGSLNKLVYYFRALSSLEILDLFNKNKESLKNSIDVKTQSMEIMNIKKIKNEIDSCYS